MLSTKYKFYILIYVEYNEKLGKHPPPHIHTHTHIHTVIKILTVAFYKSQNLNPYKPNVLLVGHIQTMQAEIRCHRTQRLMRVSF